MCLVLVFGENRGVGANCRDGCVEWMVMGFKMEDCMCQAYVQGVEVYLDSVDGVS